MKRMILTAGLLAAALAFDISPAKAFDFSEGECAKSWKTILDAYRLSAPATAPMLDDFIEFNPTGIHTNDARLLLADNSFFAHDWPEALNLYENADIKGLSQPEKSLYSYRLALTLIKTGHYSEARKALEDVKGKEYADVRNFYTAYIDYIGGDFNKAYKEFQKVTPGIKGLETGYYLLQIEYTRGEYENVVSRGNSLLYKNPVPELAPEIHRITGLSYFKLGQEDAAAVSLDNYFEQNRGTDNPDALYAMGVIEYDRGNYSEAENYLKQVTDEDGALGQSAWLYIGQCRIMNDDVQGATLAFEKAAAYDTDPKVAQTALYDYLTALTRGGNVPFSKSADMLENYIIRWPMSPHVRDVREYLAAAYFNDHSYAKAVECVDGMDGDASRAMLEIKQKALYQQGVQEFTNGNVSRSAEWFRKASEMKSTDAALAAQSLLWLGDAQYAAGNFAAAARSYTSFLNARPKSNKALGYYNLAYAEFQQGSYGKAASDFATALATRPPLNRSLANDAAIRRADCLYYTGSYSEASRIFSEAVSNNAADADYAAYRRAMLAGLTGNARDKANALAAFVRDYPNSRWCSQALLEKARAHEELGESQAAAEAYRKRININPDVDIDELLAAAKANDEAADSPGQQLEILDRIRREGDLPAEQLADIDLYEANALAILHKDTRADEIYVALAQNPSSLAGAKAAVTLANRYLKSKKFQDAFDLMNDFTEAGTPHSYWLAKGFIALADACKGLGKNDLAREYLTSLRDNYPGNEPEIFSAIESRLK